MTGVHALQDKYGRDLNAATMLNNTVSTLQFHVKLMISALLVAAGGLILLVWLLFLECKASIILDSICSMINIYENK